MKRHKIREWWIDEEDLLEIIGRLGLRYVHTSKVWIYKTENARHRGIVLGLERDCAVGQFGVALGCQWLTLDEIEVERKRMNL